MISHNQNHKQEDEHMGKLIDILNQNGSLSSIEDAWESTRAACDDDVLPRGTYLSDIIKGEAIESRSNKTPGYRLTFEVIEGDRTGSRFWHDCWFTVAALPRAKRDLGKLGVTALRQLEQPLPAVYRCEVKLVIRSNDDGGESNEVRKFKVLDVIKPEPDPFAPNARASDGEVLGDPAGSTEEAGASSVVDPEPTEESPANATESCVDTAKPSAGNVKKTVKRVVKKRVKKPTKRSQPKPMSLFDES